MEKAEISKIVESAKMLYGRKQLAIYLGINPVQINNVILGHSALPFPAAMRLSEILNADPVTITCANAALKENDPERKKYLESKILPLEVSRIICAMSTSRIRCENSNGFIAESSDFYADTKKVLQSAKYRHDLPPSDPRNWPGYRRRAFEQSFAWALRPIPSLSETD